MGSDATAARRHRSMVCRVGGGSLGRDSVPRSSSRSSSVPSALPQRRPCASWPVA